MASVATAATATDRGLLILFRSDIWIALSVLVIETCHAADPRDPCRAAGRGMLLLLCSCAAVRSGTALRAVLVDPHPRKFLSTFSSRSRYPTIFTTGKTPV
jgi:hypothetical protein